MASFFSSLVGGFANTSMARRDAEQKREDDAKKSEMQALGVAMDSGRLTDEGWNAAMSRIEELSDTKGKKGQESPLRSVLTKLRGQIPKDKQYQAQTLDQTVAAQNPRGSTGDYNTMARANAETRPVNTARGDTPPTTAPPNPRPHAFMTQTEMQQQAAANADIQTAAQTRQMIARANAITAASNSILDQAGRDIFLTQLKALPSARPTREVVQDAGSPTGWSYIFSDQNSGMTIGTMSGAPPPTGQKAQKQAFQLPDGTVTQGEVLSNGVYVDMSGKPLPSGAQPLAAASYYPKTTTGETTSINPVTGATQVLPRASTIGPALPRPTKGSTRLLMPKPPTGSPSASPKSTTDYFGVPASNADRQRELAYAYKRLSSNDRQALEALDSGKSMLDQISQDIESVGGQSGMLEQYALYKVGRPIDPAAERAIQTISLLRAQMPAAYLHGVRNTKFIDQIQSHLPAPTDSPELIMQKISTLGTLIPQVERSVWETAAPWVLQPGQTSPDSTAPSGNFTRQQGGVYVEQ